MIDTNYIDKVLEFCPYYYKIIDDNRIIDELSFDLIDWYKDFVFNIDLNNINNIDVVEKIDKCMYMYTSNYTYRSGLRKNISIKDIDFNSEKKNIKLVKELLDYKEKYEEDMVLNIVSNRWL